MAVTAGAVVEVEAAGGGAVPCVDGVPPRGASAVLDLGICSPPIGGASALHAAPAGSARSVRPCRSGAGFASAAVWTACPGRPAFPRSPVSATSTKASMSSPTELHASTAH
ncbi:hypothetical protein STRTUCAR8_10085 [Streptomyces turgidiscabies Car8]|uniref:Uncharacterized protein n=1 Tax=Streptomyces turgidiscabies (strain Car8) TaxID=698760 RepID=L7FGA1_STRT8|nr:hypothetical protein STRTUCAR8_10085 [Streptomyces turgidiscabies Car8]